MSFSPITGLTEHENKSLSELIKALFNPSSRTGKPYVAISVKNSTTLSYPTTLSSNDMTNWNGFSVTFKLAEKPSFVFAILNGVTPFKMDSMAFIELETVSMLCLVRTLIFSIYTL
jgi:hypothetical protein